MAHEIETFGTEAAAIFARTDAWHHLGTTIPADSFTAADAMTIGHLGGWNVRKAPLTSTVVEDDGVTTLEIPDKFASIRTNPFTGGVDYLGVVGTTYTPIQNEETCTMLDALVDESGAKLDTAGSLRGGKDVFVTMKLPSHILVGGVDAVDLYIAALNNHDGTASFRLVVTPIRVQCKNTEAAALQNNRGIYSIRHTTNAKAAVLEAREKLDLSFKYIEGFQAEADRMIQETLSVGAFEDIVRRNFASQGDSKHAETAADKLTEQLVALFVDADTNASIRGTRWAGYNALTEYADHYATVRSAGSQSVAAARAERVLMGAGLKLKSKAFDLFRVPVAV